MDRGKGMFPREILSVSFVQTPLIHEVNIFTGRANIGGLQSETLFPTSMLGATRRRYQYRRWRIRLQSSQLRQQEVQEFL